MTRAEFIDDGFPTPEEAARGDIPPQYARVVGVEIDGDTATVSLPDRRSSSVRALPGGLRAARWAWFATWGSGGFMTGTPDFVEEEAPRHGWRGNRA
jgi:hypothetical protein